MSNLNEEFEQQLIYIGLTNYEREYRAIPGRRFRYDFAFVEDKLLIEINGGIYRYNPSHASAGNIRRDYEKLDMAVLYGWRQLIFAPDMVQSGWALTITENVLKGETCINQQRNLFE